MRKGLLSECLQGMAGKCFNELLKFLITVAVVQLVDVRVFGKRATIAL